MGTRGCEGLQLMLWSTLLLASLVVNPPSTCASNSSEVHFCRPPLMFQFSHVLWLVPLLLLLSLLLKSLECLPWIESLLLLLSLLLLTFLLEFFKTSPCLPAVPSASDLDNVPVDVP